MHTIMQKLSQIIANDGIMSRKKSNYKAKFVPRICLIASIVFALETSFAADDAIDGTLIWVGNPSGGNWADEANWKVKEGDKGTVADLLTKRTIYDFSKLANGAVVINNWKGGNAYNAPANTLLIRGIICSGAEGDTWTITAGSNSPNPLRFSNPCEANINGGTLVINNSFSDKNNPAQTLRKTGSGKIKLMKSIKFFGFNPSIDLQAGTVELANGFDEGYTIVKMYNGATLLIASGTVKLGRVYSADAKTADSTQVLKVESGATLVLAAGFDGNEYLETFCGKMEGGGTVRLAGGQTYNLNAGADSEEFSFNGVLDVLNADVSFGTTDAPLKLNASTKLNIGANGLAIIYGKQELTTTPTGDGAAGGIVIEKNAELAIKDAAAYTEYKARFSGAGSLVKDGASNELKLSGHSDYSGATVVKAGTLTVNAAKQDAGVHYDFEDKTNLGRDASSGGNVNLSAVNNELYSCITDGAVGRAIHWDKKKNSTDAILNTESGSATGAQLPHGESSITISLWVRPAEDCGWYPDLVRFGNIASNTEKQYVVSFAMYPRDVPHEKNGICKRVAFYPFVGWSARGENAAVAELGDEGYSIVDGKWHHIACTFNATTKIASIYVDGVLKGTITRDKVLSIIDNPGLRIGNANSSNEHQTYSGDFDEVKVLPIAWTAEEVAAEYATRGSAVECPAPIAYWDFDKCDNEGSGSFTDDGSLGLKLESVTENGTPGVVATVDSTTTRDGRRIEFAKMGSSYSGKTRTDASALRLAEGDGDKLANAIAAGSSFTVSARLSKQAGTGVFMIIGDGSAAGSVRMEYLNATPRRLVWLAGSDKWHPWGSDGIIDVVVWNANQLASAWNLCTVTYDAASKKISYYMDSVELYSETRELAAINFKDIVFGAKTRNSETGVISDYVASPTDSCQIDDLAIFDCALTKEQVKKHARSVIGIAADATVLPTVSPVTVEDNATLRVLNGNEKFKSLSGAGDVEISRSSSLTLNGIDNFTGRILGPGDLFLGGKVQLTSKVAVENPITITSITTDKDGTTLPMVDGRDKIAVASSGVFTLENDRQIVSKMYPIARNVTEYVLPEDASGWKLVPESKLARFSFVVRDGVLYARVAGKSLTICVR